MLYILRVSLRISSLVKLDWLRYAIQDTPTREGEDDITYTHDLKYVFRSVMKVFVVATHLTNRVRMRERRRCKT